MIAFGVKHHIGFGNFIHKYTFIKTESKITAIVLVLYGMILGNSYITSYKCSVLMCVFK